MKYSPVRAFAPASIGCILKTYPHKNPRWAGSYGVGFTLKEGVFVAVSKAAKTQVFFNNKTIFLPTVRIVLKRLTKEKMRVEISSKLPLGCGFGLSGASALATAYAVNKLLKLGHTKKELAIVAHIADVENKTGLGDVANQYYGGFFLKTKPSSHFAVIKVPVTNRFVYCKVFSALPTKDVLSNNSLVKHINEAGRRALQKVQTLLVSRKPIPLGKILMIAKEFALQSTLLENEKLIDAIYDIEKKRGNASMIILGNAIVSDIPFEGAIKLKIGTKGAYLLWIYQNHIPALHH